MFDEDLTEHTSVSAVLKQRRLLVVTACDSSYLPHAELLTKSMDLFSPGQRILIHLICPTEGDIQRITSLSTRLKNTEVHLSSVNPDLSGLSEEVKKTYFACARFLLIDRLLPRANCDFLVLDADSLIVGKFDYDFSEKPETELCMLRRDISGEKSRERVVAAGTIWIRPTAATQRYISIVGKKIINAFSSSTAAWYLDQVSLFEAIGEMPGNFPIRNIKSKYASFSLAPDSIVWQAKGDQKYFDIRYVALLLGISAKRPERSVGLGLLAYMRDKHRGQLHSGLANAFDSMLLESRRRVVILVPRLDLPWKEPASVSRKSEFHLVDQEVINLRSHWVAFASLLASCFEVHGFPADIKLVPNWEITPSYVDSLNAALVLVPHRCRFEFEGVETPVAFYMQEYFSWMFVVDTQGWNAASSRYPIEPMCAPDRGATAFPFYKAKLMRGELATKFKQPALRDVLSIRSSVRDEGWNLWSLFRGGSRNGLAGISSTKSRGIIFFPLQIPHDQTIKYFSDFSLEFVLDRVIDWARGAGVTVVLKPHPANYAVTRKLGEKYLRDSHVFLVDENIHQLIELSDAVFTINGGVGFEAILHGKPIVTFGRCDYDSISIKANPDSIGGAWEACLAEPMTTRIQRYIRFFDYFCDDYAVDMSRPSVARQRLFSIVAHLLRHAEKAPVVSA